MEWLKNEIRTGFQKLITVSLPRTPAADVIRATVEVWAEALTGRLDFDQARDTPRIRRAFSQLVLTATEWPTPAAFLTEFARTAPDQPRITKDRRIPHAGDTSERARLARLRHLGEIFASDPNLKPPT